ncbi:alpha/beta fold hydrolase [Streptomyces sp. NPDC056721]|uniref:alpha/beta fold hydrolase n=1 Tax=unclassified Streptomyces TaxID=2593676 RepID=UPI003625DB53
MKARCRVALGYREVGEPAHLVGWSDGALDTLAEITAPPWCFKADRDEVTVEHSLAVVAALPEARLAVLPGTHTLPLEGPELVNWLILSFLRGADPAPDWSAFTG